MCGECVKSVWGVGVCEVCEECVCVWGVCVFEVVQVCGE